MFVCGGVQEASARGRFDALQYSFFSGVEDEGGTLERGLEVCLGIDRKVVLILGHDENGACGGEFCSLYVLKASCMLQS